MLAEKHRPKIFDDVIGQDRVIAGTRWMLDHSENAAGPSILYTGPSGSGKTTLAECAATYWGITELDRWRIESAECDVARLRELAADCQTYGSGPTSRKLYLVDEIHTLTQRAKDRLLSLLENLPAHVLFVGTTTEENWCEPTLFSRFSRFPLAKLSSATVVDRLLWVASHEGLPVPEGRHWAERLVKYEGLNLRDLLNNLPQRAFAAA